MRYGIYVLPFVLSALLSLTSSATCKPAHNDVAVAKSKHGPSRKMMVPPPPPEMPFVGRTEGQSLTAGIPLDYMSKADLERLKVRLETQVAKLNKEKTDHDTGLKEKKERRDQFESLYKEGVVSRRELESARRELDDEQQIGSDFGDRFKDASIDLQRVKKQLSSMEKSDGKGSLKKISSVAKEKRKTAVSDSK